MDNTILIDMDGVITDTMGKIFELLYEEVGVKLVHADMPDYYMGDTGVELELVLEMMRRRGFYIDLKPITGAIDATNRLREKYNVKICSSPITGAEYCEAEKREWLYRHFDFDFSWDAIITDDKTKIDGKLLIEDKPDISRTAKWQAVMFDQKWNRGVEDLPRMYGWHDLDVIYKLMDI